MEEENLAGVVCECLHLDCPEPDLKDWTEMVDYLKNPTTEVTVALVGKYIQLHDAYISVVEALKHGGIFSRATVNIKWIDSETVTADNAEELFSDVSGILVPGGFGNRGIEGKIEAIKYARTHNIPFLGLCLGMQLSIVEFAEMSSVTMMLTVQNLIQTPLIRSSISCQSRLALKISAEL